MSVLVSQRGESRFEVFHNAYKIRKMATDLALREFGYKRKVIEYETEQQRERRKGFEEWFIDNSRESVISACRTLINNLTAANAIFPNCKEELTERRVYQDRALGAVYVIAQELQYAMETLPVDVNKFLIIAEPLEKEIGLIKQWRKSDNKRFKFVKNK